MKCTSCGREDPYCLCYPRRTNRSEYRCASCPHLHISVMGDSEDIYCPECGGWLQERRLVMDPDNAVREAMDIVQRAHERHLGLCTCGHRSLAHYFRSGIHSTSGCHLCDIETKTKCSGYTLDAL